MRVEEVTIRVEEQTHLLKYDFSTFRTINFLFKRHWWDWLKETEDQWGFLHTVIVAGLSRTISKNKKKKSDPVSAEMVDEWIACWRNLRKPDKRWPTSKNS